MPPWAAVVVGVCGVGIAMGGVWRALVRPALRTAVVVEAMAPTLRQIASDFRPNGQPTLKSQITQMRKDIHSNTEDLRKIKEKLGA